MAERKCLMCGKPFPPDTFASRKYCHECHLIRVVDVRQRAAERRREREREKKARPQPMFIQRKSPNKNDERYCSRCRYQGKTGVNLCDYFYRTGERRGCPAGVGCNKRRTQS